MTSEQKSLELGEMFTDFKSDRIETENIKGTAMDPIFKNIKVNFGRPMGWDKILIILIFLMVLVLLVLVVILMTLSYYFNQEFISMKSSEKNDEACLTFSCLQSAVEINKSINPDVDPCTDFHQFVCGKWESEQIIPKGTSRYGTFDVVNTELFKIQKKILENQIVVNETTAWAKAIRLYNSCIDIEQINKLGAQPLKDHLKNVFDQFGGWDMLTEHSYYPVFSPFQLIVEHPAVFSPIFNIVVYDDEKNSKKNIIYLHLASLLLEKQYLQNITKPVNKKIIDAYVEYMKNIGKLLGVNPRKLNQFDDVIQLEAKVAIHYPKEEEHRDPDSSYNKMSISALERDICPLLNWTNIFLKRFQSLYPNISRNTEIIVVAPDHLKQICALFSDYNSDPSRKLILHNYLVWRMISQMVKYLSHDFIDAFAKFNKVYRGSSGIRERWEICVTVMQDNMWYVLGNMYVSQQFDKRSKPQVLEMINFMKDKFRENLLSNNWMDAATVFEAIKKIDSMWPIIGYSEVSLNRTFIEEYYNPTIINNDTYYENIYRLDKLSTLRNYEKLSKPTENSTIETPQEVNAFYNANKNEILFPAGILQNPFFDPGFPISLKYGGIGSAMGHEIIHGFDDSGSKYDSIGNLRSWWTNETRALFKNKSDCIVQQYSKYHLYGQDINALNTLGENIADNGGLRLSYQIFKGLEKRFGVEKRLPGLRFSHDQLFFISFARVWCNLETKQSTLISIFSNSHTPNMFRIIGVLSNMKEFSEAFNCPAGTPMNPDKKCIVW